MTVTWRCSGAVVPAGTLPQRASPSPRACLRKRPPLLHPWLRLVMSGPRTPPGPRSRARSGRPARTRRSCCCAGCRALSICVACAREHGREALLSPLTEGLDIPRDLDLGDRSARVSAATLVVVTVQVLREGGQRGQDGRTRNSSVRSTGVPSTGAGSSVVGSIPPAAVLSSVARPSGPTVPNTV